MAVKYTDFEFIKKYDRNNNEIYYKTSDGIERIKKYDENNNPVYIRDSKGNETFIKYDDKNRKICITKNEFSEYFDYDDRHNATIYRNSRGEYKRTIKNADGKTLAIETENSCTEFKYDEFGNCIAKNEIGGLITDYVYDENNNLIELKNSVGYWEKYEYDDRGNLIRKCNSYGLIIDYEYDEFDNKIFEYNNSTKTEIYYSYIRIGDIYLVASIVDSTGKKEKFEYDDRGNKIKWQESLFEKIYKYDNNGNLIFYSRKYIKRKR